MINWLDSEKPRKDTASVTFFMVTVWLEQIWLWNRYLQGDFFKCNFCFIFKFNMYLEYLKDRNQALSFPPLSFL